jgi:nitronate monooxygenase
MGSAFLSCPEASISDAHRLALRNARDDDTRLTRAFSGRPARAKNSNYIETMAANRNRFPDFPLMYRFSRPLMQSSADNHDTDFNFLLYGQATTLNRELPASELMSKLVDEAQRLLPPMSPTE